MFRSQAVRYATEMVDHLTTTSDGLCRIMFRPIRAKT